MPTHCFLLFYVGLTHGVPASNSNSDVVKKKKNPTPTHK